jgi:hypothetical protein
MSRKTFDQSQFMATTELGVAGATRRMVPSLRAIRVAPCACSPYYLLLQPRRTRVCESILAVLNVLVLSIVIPLISPDLASAEFSGPVVSVLDGDTIEVLHKNNAERISLNGISCPEKCQAW